MSIENEIKQLELDIETAKKHLKRYEALTALRKNKDWAFIIDEVYLKEEPARLVLLKAAQQMESQESQLRILNQIDAVGHLHQFFLMIEAFGREAAAALQQHEETLDELRGELE